MTIFGIWNPAKRKAKKLLRAYTGQAGGHLVPAARVPPMRPGRDHWVFYGVDEVTRPFFDLVAHQPRAYTYIDNGYLGSKYHGAKAPQYRITRGATQHAGTGKSDGTRFAALGIDIKPWREDGRHVLIALQSPWWFIRHGIDRDAWLARVREGVRVLTGRPVVVREKPPRIDLVAPVAEDLRDAWCVVTHSSNVAVDGILAGVPAIVLGRSAAASMAGHSIEAVLEPPTPKGRRAWASILADNQWTLAEIAEGLPARTLGRARPHRVEG